VRINTYGWRDNVSFNFCIQSIIGMEKINKVEGGVMYRVMSME